MAALRREGPHRRFHAQGTTTRLAWKPNAIYVAKGHKDHAGRRLIFVLPSSVTCSSVLRGPPIEGYVPFLPFL